MAAARCGCLVAGERNGAWMTLLWRIASRSVLWYELRDGTFGFAVRPIRATENGS